MEKTILRRRFAPGRRWNAGATDPRAIPRCAGRAGGEPRSASQQRFAGPREFPQRRKSGQRQSASQRPCRSPKQMSVPKRLQYGAPCQWRRSVPKTRTGVRVSPPPACKGRADEDGCLAGRHFPPGAPGPKATPYGADRAREASQPPRPPGHDWRPASIHPGIGERDRHL